MDILMILGSLFAASFAVTYLLGQRLGRGFVALFLVVSLVPAAWGLDLLFTGVLGDYLGWVGGALVVALLSSLFPVLGYAAARRLLAPKKAEPDAIGFSDS